MDYGRLNAEAVLTVCAKHVIKFYVVTTVGHNKIKYKRYTTYLSNKCNDS